MTPSEDGESSVRYRIRVNGVEQSVDRPQLAVFEIRALFGLDPNMELIVEAEGREADMLLGPDQVIALKPDRVINVFSRPHTMFG
jgi:hypothetical protein